MLVRVGISAKSGRSGIDWRRLLTDLGVNRGDIDVSFARTDREARRLNIGGTPAIVIGDQLFVGRLSANQLKQAIALSRGEKIVPATAGYLEKRLN
jgi:hypothetical protein